jgi:hypothetical protein
MRKTARTLTHAHSDSEADPSGHFYSLVNNLPPLPEEHGNRYERLNSIDGDQTDDLDDDDKNIGVVRERSFSLDEFGDHQDPASRLVRTGRQRKKLAARSKGGEFRTKRKKRRVYFCCASSEIDVQKLFDYLVGAGSLLNGWKYQLHADVLHLYKPGSEGRNLTVASAPVTQQWPERSQHEGDSVLDNMPIVDLNGNLDVAISDAAVIEMHMRGNDAVHANNVRFADGISALNSNTGSTGELWSDNSRISGLGAQEVFVFDFGAAVFWVSCQCHAQILIMLSVLTNLANLRLQRTLRDSRALRGERR